MSPMRAEQVDLAACHMGALDPLPNLFLVECKYWDKPMTSTAVGYFINTCANRLVALGIILSKEGLTGNKDEATNAHSLAYGAASRGVHILVVTLDDLKALNTSDDLVTLLRRAWIRAVATGGVGMS